MKRYPFHTAYTQARDFYGVELTPIDFENIGLVAWNKIGNKDYKLYKYVVKPQITSSGEYKWLVWNFLDSIYPSIQALWLLPEILFVGVVFW